ncbi:UBA-like protein, partial [Corchorus capsularis]
MGSDSKSNGSGRGGGGGAGGGGGVQIPASVKKVVQNLKEIVDNNCTDSEIYAVLRDCNMDPNDAVQRLLSQDTFHEVKSRRERRKE